MRRKSERNKSKSSPESKPEKPKRGRPSRKKKSPSSSPERDSTSEDCVPASIEESEVQNVSQSQVPCQSETVTPEKVQSHSDEDNLEVWHVKASETSDTGEIQKLKICLSRPSMTPERPDRSPRGRKKLNRSTSQLECLIETADEKRKGRHRSRRSSAKDAESTDIPNSDDNIEGSLTSDTDGKVEKSGDSIAQPSTDTDSKTTQEACEITSVEKNNDDPASPTRNTSVVDKSQEENSSNICNKDVLQESIVTSVNVSELEPVIEKDGDDEKSVEETSKPIEKPAEENKTVETQKETTIPLKIAPVANENQMITRVDSEIEVEKSSKDIQAADASVIADKSTPAEKSDDKSVMEIIKPPLDLEKKPDNESLSKQDTMNEVNKDTITCVQVPGSTVVQEEKNKEDFKCSVNSTVDSKETIVRNKSPEITKVETVVNPSTSDDSIDIKPVSNNSELQHEVRIEPLHGDKLNADKTSEQLASIQDTQAAQSAGNMRKRRWGSRSSKVSKSTIVNISTDSLKNLISNVEPVSAEEVLLEVIVKEDVEIEPPKKVLTECQNKTNGKYNVQDKVVDKEFLGNMSHRKISIVNEEAPKLHRSPSPPKYKSSSILYITNLVRPFTLPQLKNLLQRTGRIVENGFWIDKIKSKCYVQYETEDEAIETRHALHGVTWPVSNPKVLNVDFGSKSAMQEALASGEEEKPIGHVENWIKEQHVRDSKAGLMDTEQKGSDKRTVVREWDLGKGDIKEDKPTERHVNRHRDGIDAERRKRRTKSRSPSPARKFKKKEEEAPSKLLDDLFKKTKTTPCIYWLPLNAETILIKEEQRRMHMAEHERRMKELQRATEEQKGGRHNAPSHHAPTHRHR